MQIGFYFLKKAVKLDDILQGVMIIKYPFESSAETQDLHVISQILYHF